MSKTLIITAAVLILIVSVGAPGERSTRRKKLPPRDSIREKRAKRAPDARSEPSESRSRSRGDRLTSDQEDELLNVLKKKRPDHYERMIHLRKRNPRTYRRAMQRTWKWYQKWNDMPDKIRDDVFKLEQKRLHIGKLARKIRWTRNKQRTHL